MCTKESRMRDWPPLGAPLSSGTRGCSCSTPPQARTRWPPMRRGWPQIPQLGLGRLLIDLGQTDAPFTELKISLDRKSVRTPVVEVAVQMKCIRSGLTCSEAQHIMCSSSEVRVLAFFPHKFFFGIILFLRRTVTPLPSDSPSGHLAQSMHIPCYSISCTGGHVAPTSSSCCPPAPGALGPELFDRPRGPHVWFCWLWSARRKPGSQASISNWDPCHQNSFR